MANTYYYGPQAWTAGTFTVPTTDTGDGNYPETTYRERIFTTNGAGPAGERIIDSADYAVSAHDEVVTYFDARGLNDGNGLFYEVDCKFDSGVEAEIGNFAYPLNVGVGSMARVFVQFRVAMTEGKIYITVHGDGEEETSASISADDQWHTLKAQIVPSSDNGDTMQDGIVRVWLDGVLVYEITNSWAWVHESTNPLFNLNFIAYGHFGILPATNGKIYTVTLPRRAVVVGWGAADDDTAKVISDRTILLNVDGEGRTVDEPDTVVIAGKLKVLGETTLSGGIADLSAALDALGT